jgi:hypothetical protein
MKNNSSKKSKPAELIVVKNPEILTSDKFDKLRENGAGIIIKTLNIFANPVNAKNINSLGSGKPRQFFDLIIVLAVLILGAIGFFFGFIFSPNLAPVEIIINHWPAEVRSGDELTYQIKYKNKSDEILQAANLALEFPLGFDLEVTNFDNFDSQNNTFALGDLKPGASGKLELMGYAWDRFDAEQNLKTIFSCQNENGKIKRKLELDSFKLNGSVLGLELEVPNKIYAQADFVTKIKYTNDSTQTIDNANIIIRYPTTYQRQSVTTELKEVELNKFNLTDLAAGETGEIVLVGYLNENKANDLSVLDFEADFNLERNGQDLLQNRQIKSAEIGLAEFEFNSLWQPRVAVFGQDLNYQLNYHNQESCNLENLKIWFEIESPLIDWAKSNLHQAQIEDNKVVWEPLEVCEFDQAGQFEVDLKLFKQISVSNYETARNFVIHITPKASYNLSSEPEQEIIAVGQSLDILVNTDLELTAQARYFTDYGDQLGVGPLPPVVGEETRYWIGLEITNTSNEVENLNLDIDLPANVRWTGKTNVSYGGALDYNPSSHQANWKLEKLATYVGKIIPAYEIGFEIGVTPNESQIGEILTLVNSTSISGIDNFTRESLTKNIGSLSSELKYDLLVKPAMYRVEEW